MVKPKHLIILYGIWLLFQVTLLYLSGNLNSGTFYNSNFYPIDNYFSSSADDNIMWIYKNLNDKFELPSFEKFEQDLLSDGSKRKKAYDALSADFNMPSFKEFETSIIEDAAPYINSYDFSEFIFYSIFPIVIFFIIKRINKSKFIYMPANRVKAIFLIWVFIHFLLLLLSGHFFRFTYYDSNFFPFAGGIDDYDWSEFIIYTVTPIFIYFIHKFWVKDSQVRPSESNLEAHDEFSNLKEMDKINEREVPTISEVNSIPIAESVQQNNILSANKAMGLRFIYVAYIFVLGYSISAVSIDLNLFFCIGMLIIGWLSVIIIGLIRFFLKKKPTATVYLFYFFWTTIIWLFFFLGEINKTKFLQNH